MGVVLRELEFGTLSVLAAASLILGMLAHQIFRRYETFSITAHASLLFVPPMVVALGIGQSETVFHGRLLFCFPAYWITILASLVQYRVSHFHPLARYPGPLACKISKLTWAFLSLKGYPHYRLKRWHERYGDVVRIGPNELSIRDVDTIEVVFGASGLPKSTMFIGGTLGTCTSDDETTMIAIIDVDKHLRRRKGWNRALGVTAVKEYGQFISARTRQFLECLETHVGNEVNLSKWINGLSYDSMSDMAFGGGSELMQEGDRDTIWSTIEHGVMLGTFFSHVPWLGVYVGRIPGAVGPLNSLMTLCRNFAAERIRRGSTTKDLFHYLTNEDKPDKASLSLDQLGNDGMLAVIAGADTTSSALTSIVFCLLTDPAKYATLQAEVDRFFPQGEDPLLGGEHNRNMHYLNAVINETLRLYPPVPGGGQRRVFYGSNPVVSASIVIPPGTSVWIPTYTLHRDPRNFSSPDAFLPERWLVTLGHLEHLPHGHVVSFPPEDFVHNEAAFVPFSYGPMNCAGKNLALLELRMTVCALLQRFQMRLKNGWDTAEFERGYKDYFVAARPELPVVLEARW